MIKLIASDMDGTLLDKNHGISEENIAAIKEAESKGIKFVIVTGRSYDDVRPIIEQYDLDCECVALNGAAYYDKDGNILEAIYIDKSRVREILEVMLKGDFSVEIYTNQGYYTTNTKEELWSGMLRRSKTFYPHLSEEERIEVAKKNPHFISMNYINDIDEFLNSDVRIYKFVTFGETEEDVKKLREEVKKVEGVAISASFTTNIEVNDSKATKGLILAKAAKDFGMSRDEVMVLGDGLNDYSMFEEFTNSVAMDNAIPEIKEIAKYITDTNNNSGVGKAIRRLIDGEF